MSKNTTKTLSTPRPVTVVGQSGREYEVEIREITVEPAGTVWAVVYDDTDGFTFPALIWSPNPDTGWCFAVVTS